MSSRKSKIHGRQRDQKSKAVKSDRTLKFDTHPGVIDESADLIALPDYAQWIILIIITLIGFIPAFTAQYLWDDAAVTGNLLLRTGHGLKDIWLHPSLNQKESHYWPITYTSFWLEYQLWGHRPIIYHTTNILLHCCNVLLFWKLLRMIKVPSPLIAAGLFAVHPVHVESVAWIIERKDVLSALFYLVAFMSYVRFENQRRWAFYFITCLFFVAGMWTKSIVISLPLALGLWVWWKQEKVELQRYLPLFFFGHYCNPPCMAGCLICEFTGACRGNPFLH